MKITDNMIKSICSSMIYKRGVEYFSEGRVHMRKRSETELSAVVDDDELYNVYVTFKDDGIDNILCTCPYYETMQTACKHIAAVLKQRQTELDEGSVFNSENDKIASGLCGEFAKEQERKKIRASFILYLKSSLSGIPMFEMSVVLPEYGGLMRGPENFFDCYLSGKDFKLDRYNVYNRETMYFPENEDKIISILSEVYETRSSDIQIYQKALYRTVFGASVARRIMPLLDGVDFKLVHDGITMSGVRITEGNPDILVDIQAFGKEIILSLSERGFAVTADGEWFLHNDIIYHTSPQWREYFMPIYRALAKESRMQITFGGENTMLFAAYVLPKIRNKPGVVITGVDELIVNTKPEFEVCFDSDGRDLTAAVAAVYGGIRFRIPDKRAEYNDKIVIRDFEKENEILSYFDGFEHDKKLFRLSDNDDIYGFITYDLPHLAENAEIITTERFNGIKTDETINFSVSASYNHDIDLLEIGFDTDLTDEEIIGIMEALRQRSEFYRLENGSFVNLNRNDKSEQLKFLERAGLSQQDIICRRKIIPKFHMLYLESNADIKKDKSIAEYINEIRSREIKLPGELDGVLRQYQLEGVKWFTQLSDMDMGGVLADDMGLGKTLQVIAFVHGIRPEKPVLIVAPSTLVYNWQREIEKFTPDASSIIICGLKEQREELLSHVGEYEFVITSYPLLRRDISYYSSIEFSYCFIDEAQYIKNHKTMNAVSVKRIKAEHKFALTGTPIENSIMELWSIFDFVMPGYLKSPKEFRDRFDTPPQSGEINPSSETLRNIIRPFILRRMKNDVLNELPEKIETVMFAELNKEQKVIYSQFLERAKDTAKGIITSRGNRLDLLTLLLRLRQICCHPALFEDEMFGGGYSGGSGKLDLLEELIKSYTESGHRLLIFSQFRSMLDIIASKLDDDGRDYFYINGLTPADKRSEMAEQFNGGEKNIFLVSLKAGGTGLNLTGADTVIHYDPWWNPALTDQATDRAYRIGQTRSVQVIKLAAKGTIEEKILLMQEKKKMLAEDIIQVNTQTLSALTDEEIMSLFEF